MKPACLQSCALTPLLNLITVDSRNNILWNGTVATEAQLTNYLRQSAKLVPRPIAFFQNRTGSSCGAAERIRRLMDQNLHCASDGPCGEGDLSTWERTPATSGTIVS